MGTVDPTAWWRERFDKRWRTFARRKPGTAAVLSILGTFAVGSAKIAAKQILPKRWRP